MIINELSPHPLAKTKKRRVGRGIGSGMGKTSTRGQKGAGQRSGAGLRTGFEGGQMPLMRRLPKRGFTNIFSKEYAIVNVSDLNRFNDGDVVELATLMECGLVGKALDGLKILGNGEIEKKLTVKAKIFSAAAKEKIEAAGGKTEVV